MPTRAAVVALASLVVVGILLVAYAPSIEESQAQARARGTITGLRQIGELALPPPHGDVWFHGGYAYLGTWSDPCPGHGVKIIDVRNASAPRHVTSIATYANTSAEDVVVASVSTPRFRGDLLAVGLQPCTPEGKAGLDLWDVSDPAAPKHLAYFFIPPGGVHELSMIQRPFDERVLALVAIPYAEMNLLHGEFRIVDVTDPQLPFLASEWGIVEQRGTPPEASTGASPTVYAHSVLPSRDGLLAYVSYWDAGVQILDIRDPERPRHLGNTSYPSGAEGNAHSVDVDDRRDLLFQADEDIEHRAVHMFIASPPELAGEVGLVEADFGPRVSISLGVNATVVPVGRGCANDTYARDPSGAVALVERGDCVFTEKVEKAQAAGARAVLVVNNLPGPAAGMSGNATGITIPSFMIDLMTGTLLRAAAENGTARVELSQRYVHVDPWGTIRIFDINDPARPVQIGEYATPHARNDPPAEGSGSYTVHNPVYLPGDEVVVASWFSDGVRVLDMSDPRNVTELANWVPPIPAGDTPFARGIWGVYVDDDTIYAGDMGAGLYVLQLERGAP